MVLVGVESVMNGRLQFVGLFCKILSVESSLARLRTNNTRLPMKKETSEQTTWHMEGDPIVSVFQGLISVTDRVDGKKEEIHLWVGSDNLNDAIARCLPYCDRSTQERFLQILTDHIRKVDSIEA